MRAHRFGDVLTDSIDTVAGGSAQVMVIGVVVTPEWGDVTKYKVIGLTDKGRTGYRAGEIEIAHHDMWIKHE